MTDLERFRDHCRAMSQATRFTPVRINGELHHASPAERALWAQLAAEIDDYLTADHDHDQPMLGEA